MRIGNEYDEATTYFFMYLMNYCLQERIELKVQ